MRIEAYECDKCGKLYKSESEYLRCVRRCSDEYELARNAGVISDKEFTLAENAIKKYMDELSGKDRKYSALSSNLYISGFKDYSADWYKGGGDKFYWNWNKRPRK